MLEEERKKGESKVHQKMEWTGIHAPLFVGAC